MTTVEDLDHGRSSTVRREQPARAAAPSQPQNGAAASTDVAAQSGEHFIPLRKRDIVNALQERGPVPGSEAPGDFVTFCDMVSHMLHYEYFDKLEALRNDYFFFNPDNLASTGSETVDIRAVGAEQVDLEETYESLSRNFEAVMTAANFTEISLEEALKYDKNCLLSDVKVKIDSDAFRDIRVFVRGTYLKELTKPKWFGLAKRKFEGEIYENVVLFIAVHDEEERKPRGRHRKRAKAKMPPGSVIIKFFKDIVKGDLRTVFPNARVVMGRGDILSLGLPALAGVIAMGIKLLPAMGVILLVLGSYLWGEAAAAKDPDLMSKAIAALTVVGAFFAFLARQWFNYQRRSLTYQKQVSETVYFSNINNNSGIFEYLIGAAEEQEIKEALLAYHFLATTPEPVTETDLDRRIEVWLKERFDLELDFEVSDALDKLKRFEIVYQDAQGRLTAPPLPVALRKLDERWDNFFQYNGV